jgi:hypothetical protein
MATAGESSGGNAWVESYLDAREYAPSSLLDLRMQGVDAVLFSCRWLEAGQTLTTCLPALAAVLTYGLSSEYLKSTKEAEAKEKVPDANRSLYRCGQVDWLVVDQLPFTLHFRTP